MGAGRRGPGGARERVEFAGPEAISLYAEVEDGRAEVFVRDRGPASTLRSRRPTAAASGTR